MPVKELREQVEPPWTLADWTKAKAANPWIRFDPKAPKNRPRIHRADAEKLKLGRIDPDTFELINIQGEGLPSIAAGEILEEYLSDSAARKADIDEDKGRFKTAEK